MRIESCVLAFISVLCLQAQLATSQENISKGLQLTFAVNPSLEKSQEQLKFTATYVNLRATPILMTFFGNQFLEVFNASSGNIIPPEPGPERPCGAAEYFTEILPHQPLYQAVGLECTQPVGEKERIGWLYNLPKGDYLARLIFEFPPKHHFGDRSPELWRGKLVSNKVGFTLEASTTITYLYHTAKVLYKRDQKITF